jgi:hypothetical protein
MRYRPPEEITMKNLFALSVAGLVSLGAFSAPSALAGGVPPMQKQSPRFYQSYSYYGRSSADMVVRPDVILVNFTLTKTTEEPEAGLEAIQSFVEDLKKRYQAASETAEIQARDMTVRPTPEKHNPNLQTVVVSGAIELPLAPEWDYWKRAHLLMTLVQLAKAVAAEQKDAKKAILAQIAQPTALFKNPELFRSELIKRWIEHVRSFSVPAQTQAAPLELQQCEPPGNVTQQHISLEEVALILHLSCRLDVMGVRGRGATSSAPYVPDSRLAMPLVE